VAAGHTASFTKRAFIAAAAALSATAALLLLWHAADVLLLVFGGALLAVLLYGLAAGAAKLLRISYRKAFALTLVSLITAACLAGWFVANRLAGEFDQLSQRLPAAAADAMERLERFAPARLLLKDAPQPQQFLRQQRDLLQRATGIVSTTLSAVTSAFVILFLAIYLSFDPGLYRRGVLQLFPPGQRDRVSTLLDRVTNTLWWWLLAHFSAMAVVGVLTTIGLYLLGIPLASVLGLIAATLAFVPNIGPVLSAVPAILIAVSDSPDKVLYVILLYVGVQAVETNLITPMVQLRAVSLPPALTIAAQLLLGSLAGIVGLLVAAPLCATALVVVQVLWVERHQQATDRTT
jgi:predicted PurR-regulated permease PerM